MAVSEMQIELLLRPSMADFQRAVFKVADKLQRDQLAINVQEIEKGFRDGQKAILAHTQPSNITGTTTRNFAVFHRGRGTWNGQS